MLYILLLYELIKVLTFKVWPLWK